jgi:hypothetical protein
MMFKHHLLCTTLFIIACMSLPARSLGQQSANASTNDLLNSLRSDMGVDKTAIVTDAMKLQPGEADKFWSIYREYEAEVAKLNEQRIEILQEYAAQYSTLTDSEAKMLAEKSFDWESRRTQLRRSYFNKFLKATSAITAAKFFQIEHRLDLISDLNLAVQIPALFEKAPGSSP